MQGRVMWSREIRFGAGRKADVPGKSKKGGT